MNRQPVIRQVKPQLLQKKQNINKPIVQRIVKARTTIPKYERDNQIQKIAIVQGGAWGDNINSTLMLKPLKDYFEHCIIDVHTSVIYANAFYNNQYINKVVEHTALNKNDSINLALSIPPILKDSNYNIILAPHPVFNPDKWSCRNHPEWGENLIFAWVRALEDLGIPYGNSLETVLKLTDEEESRAKNKISGFINGSKKTNIMEIHGESGQTFWNHDWTQNVVKKLVSMDQIVFISYNGLTDQIKQLQAQHPSNILYIGDLSIRECAYVFNQCDRFFSVSSGLSNACNTNYCKKTIEWIETVNSLACSSAAIRQENKTFWHENDIDKFLENCVK